MNVLVIGAAGKSGQLVVDRALAAGHTVTAFVHDASGYHAPSGVRVVAGDATDRAALAPAVEGQHGVVDTVGGKSPWKNDDLKRSTAAALVDVMKQKGVRRLVVISALGVGDSAGQANLFYGYLLMPTFLRGTMKDGALMEAEVKANASAIDFVLVRPPALNEEPAKGNLRVFPEGETANSVTRADLAQFLVEQLTSDAHVGRAVVVAND